MLLQVPVHDPSVCVFMYGQATESRWVKLIKLFGESNLTPAARTCI